MAQKEKIEYIRYYAVGTAAHKVERQPEKKVKKTIVPEAPMERITVAFDPVAVMGTLVAAVMLVCVIVGFCQVNAANDQVQAMETYISGLNAQNARLAEEYVRGYDLEEVRIAASSMGLIPMEEARHITITIPEVVEEPEPTWWEELISDFQELFA